MNNRGPPPPPPVGAMPVFHDGPRPPQQQGFPPQGPAQQRYNPPPFINTTRVSDITPPVTLTEDFCRRQLTSYEVHSLRKAPPIRTSDFLDNGIDEGARKQKNGSKRRNQPKPTWERATVTVERFDQELIRKKIIALERDKLSITDKKEKLSDNMNKQVNKVLDERNGYEPELVFIWTLTQLHQAIAVNKETNKKQTETLTLYLKRAPRPELDVMMVFHNVERARLQQNRPQQQGPPQQRAPSQGPPGPPGPPRGPGRVGPPPVQIVHEGPRMGGKPGGKAGQDDIIHVVETGGPRRRAGKTIYKNRKSTHYHSSASESGRSSRSSSSSRSESGSNSAYSESETEPSSISASSKIRRRRDLEYIRGKGKGFKQHEKGDFMADRPRRHSASYVPDPPQGRAQSYERLRTNPIEFEHQLSEAKAEGFAAGFTTAARTAAVERTTMPLQRAITYADDHSQRSSLRSLDDDVRVLDDTRAEVLRLENLRLQDELQLREERRLREDFRLRDEVNARLRDDVRRFSSSELPTRDELRLRTEFRRAQDIIRQDEPPLLRRRDTDYPRRGSLSPLLYDNLPSPRGRGFDYTSMEPLSPVRLDDDLLYHHVRHPFTPRRREPIYRD